MDLARVHFGRGFVVIFDVRAETEKGSLMPLRFSPQARAGNFDTTSYKQPPSRSRGGGLYWTGELGPETGPHRRPKRSNEVLSRRAKDKVGRTVYYYRPKIMAARPVAQAAPAPAPAPNTHITVNPNIQTQVSPQISPVFQQTGSGDQSAGTSMVAPGGQRAPGNNNDIGDFLRVLQAQEQARNAQYERDRQREREDRERQKQEDLARTQRFEQQRLENERLRKEREAELEAERQRRLEEATQKPVGAQPPSAAPVNIPGAYVGPENRPQKSQELIAPQKAEFPVIPVIVGLVVLGGAYALSQRGKKKR